MMSIYTEEVLDKSSEKELISIPLTLQNKVESANNDILKEVRVELEISWLEAKNSAVKQTNLLLLKRYGKTILGKHPVYQRECLEVVSILSSVQNNK